MDIAITGGTGFIGSHLANELASREDVNVTALSRNPNESTVEINESVNREHGDVQDRETIDFDGYDAVVHLVSLSPLFKQRKRSHSHVHLEGTRNVLREAIEEDVDRFIHMSALGADPNGPTEYLRVKGQAERRVTEKDIDWTVFRPSVVFGEGGEFIPFTKKLTTPYITGLPGGGKNKFQPIWVSDLAGMLADAAMGGHEREKYDIGGPNVLSFAEVCRLIYHHEGKSIRVIPIPMTLVGLGLTVLGAIPFFPLGADQYRSLKLDNIVEGENGVEAFGKDKDDLLAFRDYLDGG